jgi:carbonic anhydrase/acetyltransferase-like protein (isoleucine patch superfamily)
VTTTHSITVGAETNVQDFTMLREATVGSGITIGHKVIAVRATVGDDVLLGMLNMILPAAPVGDNCIVAAGTVVREVQEIPEATLPTGLRRS